MGDTTKPDARERWHRLDRIGRRLVILGAIVTVILTLLALVLALSVLPSLECFSFNPRPGCQEEVLSETWPPAIGATVAVIVIVVMMLRGGSASLALGGIGAFLLGVVGTYMALTADARPDYSPLLAVFAPGAFMLALGAALRLIARYASGMR